MHRSLAALSGVGLLAVLPALAGLSTLVGCAKHGAEQGPAEAKPGDSAAAADDEPAGLAELGEEDRRLATDQRFCPVSDALLGTMGAPYKMLVEGQPVFLCCEHCKSDVEKDPDAILAKLSK